MYSYAKKRQGNTCTAILRKDKEEAHVDKGRKAAKCQCVRVACLRRRRGYLAVVSPSLQLASAHAHTHTHTPIKN